MMDRVFARLEKHQQINVQQLKAEIESPRGGQKKILYAENKIMPKAIVPETIAKPKQNSTAKHLILSEALLIRSIVIPVRVENQTTGVA